MKMDRYWEIRCPHCGSPDKANWINTCRWNNLYPTNRQSGGDPPCSWDEYVVRDRKKELKNILLFWLFVFFIFGGGGLYLLVRGFHV